MLSNKTLSPKWMCYFCDVDFCQHCNWGLSYLLCQPVVNLTNAPWAAFALISLRQEITNLRCNYKKLLKRLLYEKAAHSMLTKLTPDWMCFWGQTWQSWCHALPSTGRTNALSDCSTSCLKAMFGMSGSAKMPRANGWDGTQKIFGHVIY